jgi:hypothetical protein
MLSFKAQLQVHEMLSIGILQRTCAELKRRVALQIILYLSITTVIVPSRTIMCGAFVCYQDACHLS